MSLRAKNGLRRLTLSILLSSTALSACSAGPPEALEDPTEESVEQAWTEAAECLTNRGYDVQKDRDGNNWSLVFDGEVDGVIFDLRYEQCVGDAEAINKAFLRTQVPEGAQRIEMATEFQSCLSSAGLENPVAYDPNNPDSSAVLADAIEKMGYSNGDLGVADDPRFSEILMCFNTYELLFPDRFSE